MATFTSAGKQIIFCEKWRLIFAFEAKNLLRRKLDFIGGTNLLFILWMC